MMDELMKHSPYSVSIDYNPHKTVHSSIEDYYEKDEFLDYEECIKKDRVFSIRVYANTSVTFYSVCASEYKVALEAMVHAMERERG